MRPPFPNPFFPGHISFVGKLQHYYIKLYFKILFLIMIFKGTLYFGFYIINAIVLGMILVWRFLWDFPEIYCGFLQLLSPCFSWFDGNGQR